MDLKSYLRGLGIGIAVTTIVLTVSFMAAKQEPSAQEIVSRAKELGMVESSAFLQNTTEPVTQAPSETQSQSITEKATEKVSEETTEMTTQETSEMTMEPSKEVITEPETTTVSKEWTTIVKETTTVDLYGFAAAHQAAAMLETAGVIDDAAVFTTYMIENDYATHLLPGTYTFEKGMTYEQIAKRICWMD